MKGNAARKGITTHHSKVCLICPSTREKHSLSSVPTRVASQPASSQSDWPWTVLTWPGTCHCNPRSSVPDNHNYLLESEGEWAAPAQTFCWGCSKTHMLLQPSPHPEGFREGRAVCGKHRRPTGPPCPRFAGHEAQHSAWAGRAKRVTAWPVRVRDTNSNDHGQPFPCFASHSFVSTSKSYQRYLLVGRCNRKFKTTFKTVSYSPQFPHLQNGSDDGTATAQHWCRDRTSEMLGQLLAQLLLGEPTSRRPGYSFSSLCRRKRRGLGESEAHTTGAC